MSVKTASRGFTKGGDSDELQCNFYIRLHHYYSLFLYLRVAIKVMIADDFVPVKNDKLLTK